MCVCVCVYLALYIIRHILQWSQEAKEINIDLLLPTSIQSDHWSQYQFQPLCRTQVSPMPEKMHAPNIWSATAFLCNKFVFLSVCACSVCMPSCKICGLFSQFDAISPVHLGVRVGCVWGSPWGQVVGTWLQEETLLEKSFQNTPLWEPSIWLTPWSSLLPGKCIPFCTCWGVGDVGQQLESSSSLLIGTWSHGTSWRSHKKINSELQIE